MRFSDFLRLGRRKQPQEPKATIGPDGKLIEDRRKLFQERPRVIEHRRKPKSLFDYLRLGRRKSSPLQDQVGWPIGDDRRRSGVNERRPEVIERRNNPAEKSGSEAPHRMSKDIPLSIAEDNAQIETAKPDLPVGVVRRHEPDLGPVFDDTFSVPKDGTEPSLNKYPRGK